MKGRLWFPEHFQPPFFNPIYIFKSNPCCWNNRLICMGQTCRQTYIILSDRQTFSKKGLLGFYINTERMEFRFRQQIRATIQYLYCLIIEKNGREAMFTWRLEDGSISHQTSVNSISVKGDILLSTPGIWYTKFVTDWLKPQSSISTA